MGDSSMTSMTSTDASKSSRLASCPQRAPSQAETLASRGRGRTFAYLPSATRQRWSTSFHFVIGAVGAAVGLGNIIRFPSLCYEFGGFAFLLPYFLAVAFIGLPVLAAETMLGQMVQRSAIKAYAHISPRLWGLGCFVTWAAFLVAIYYNAIMSWSWVYLVYSFYSPLPWGSSALGAGDFFFGKVLNMQAWPRADTSPAATEGGMPPPDRWSLDDGLGPVSWQVALGMLTQWLLCFLCILKGYKTIQKVVFVTVLLPFVLILILLFYGITLTGANVGLKAYVDPTSAPQKLGEWKAWTSAVGQIFFGLSLSNGVMIAYSSHEPRASKIVRNVWAVTIINSITSIVAGFAVFALLGHFASVSNQTLDQVAGDGFALSFEAFPASFAGFQGASANAMSVIFFITLLMMGIDSAMAYVQAVSEAFVDNIAWCRKRIVLVNALVCTVGFFLSLLMATKSGYYIVDILDHFTSFYLMLLGGIVATLCVGWGYPSQKLVARVKGVTEQDARWLPFLWPWLVKIVTPGILTVLFLYNLVEDVQVPFRDYPLWALLVFGWLPGLIIPVLAFGLPSLLVPVKDIRHRAESYHLESYSLRLPTLTPGKSDRSSTTTRSTTTPSSTERTTSISGSSIALAPWNKSKSKFQAVFKSMSRK